jgi:pimeloyl-ACP methyl ester carboxylesterase
MATDRFLTANGLRLHCLDYGGEGKPPLMCIHGLTGNAHNFDALAPSLVPAYHVLSLDVRGRGESQWGPPMDYTVPNYVSDAAGVIEQIGAGRKITLIGTSMGGIISIAYAGGYPDRVEKLVINDIGPDIDPAGAKRITSYVGEAPSEFADLAEVVAYFRQIYPPFARMPEPAAIEYARCSVKPTAGGRLSWKMDPAVRRAMRAGGAAARTPDLWMQYARITAPILVVRGAESDILSATTVSRMCSVLPNVPVRSIEVAGVGHAPSLTEPEALAALREFLKIAA